MMLVAQAGVRRAQLPFSRQFTKRMQGCAMRRVAPGPQGTWGHRFFATGRGRGEGGRKMLEDQLGFTGPAQPAARPSAPPPRAAPSASAASGSSGRGGGRGSGGPSPFSQQARPIPPQAPPASAAPSFSSSSPPPITPSTGAPQAATPVPGGRGRGRLEPGPSMGAFVRREPRAPGEQPAEGVSERQFIRRPRRATAEKFSASSRIGDLAAKRSAETDRPARAEPVADEMEEDLLDTMSGVTKWQAKMQTKVKREALAERRAEGLGRQEKGKKAGGRVKTKVAAEEDEASKKAKPEQPEAPPTLEEDLLAVKDEEVDEAAAAAALRGTDDIELVPVVEGSLPSPVPSPLSYLVDVVAPALKRTMQKSNEEDAEEAKKKKEDDEAEGITDEEEDAEGNKKKKEPPPEFRLGVLFREERAQDLLFRVGGKKELYAPLAIEAKRVARRNAHYRTLFKEFLPNATPEQKSERRRLVRAKLNEMKNAKKAKPKPAAPAVPVRKTHRLKRSKKRERVGVANLGKFKYHSLGVLGNRLEKLLDEMEEYDDVALQDHVTMMERALAFNPHWSETQKKTMLDRTRTEFALLPRKVLEKPESKERIGKWIYSRHWAKLPVRKEFRQAIFKPYSGPNA